mmetsp:Transcript_50800/g.84194  ORF Transcript_50800/g.84194 Transcript_50800/m.84194 type:complete len:177 (-) Transcript_50800:107-637(-)
MCFAAWLVEVKVLAKRLRKAMSPAVLAKAFHHLNPNDPAAANKRAALACGLQLLMRGSEIGVGDGKKWQPSTGVSRADLNISEDRQRLHVYPHGTRALGSIDSSFSQGKWTSFLSMRPDRVDQRDYRDSRHGLNWLLVSLTVHWRIFSPLQTGGFRACYHDDGPVGQPSVSALRSR